MAGMTDLMPTETAELVLTDFMTYVMRLNHEGLGLPPEEFQSLVAYYTTHIELYKAFLRANEKLRGYRERGFKADE